MKVLVECVKSSTDGVTRNHVFSVFSSVAKIVPEKVVEHIQDIFAVIGESTVMQVGLFICCVIVLTLLTYLLLCKFANKYLYIIKSFIYSSCMQAL